MCPSLCTVRTAELRRRASRSTLVPERGQPRTKIGLVGGAKGGNSRESGRAIRGALRRTRQILLRSANARFVLTDGRAGGGRRSPSAPRGRPGGPRGAPP